MMEKQFIVSIFSGSISDLINKVESNKLLTGTVDVNGDYIYKDSKGNYQVITGMFKANMKYDSSNQTVYVDCYIENIKILSVSLTKEEFNSIKTALGL